MPGGVATAICTNWTTLHEHVPVVVLHCCPEAQGAQLAPAVPQEALVSDA
jgi:hypothetical protein